MTDEELMLKRAVATSQPTLGPMTSNPIELVAIIDTALEARAALNRSKKFYEEVTEARKWEAVALTERIRREAAKDEEIAKLTAALDAELERSRARLLSAAGYEVRLRNENAAARALVLEEVKRLGGETARVWRETGSGDIRHDYAAHGIEEFLKGIAALAETKP